MHDNDQNAFLQNGETSEPVTIRVAEAVRLSGLSRTTIYLLINRGQLASVKVNGRRLIVYSSLRALLTCGSE